MKFLISTCRSILICSISLLLFISISGQSSPPNNYQSAEFSDTGRMEKVKATEAFIKRMFEEHAAKNNFPGFAYGVVLDGKLIYSGATGFTNVEKKIPATTLFCIIKLRKKFYYLFFA